MQVFYKVPFGPVTSASFRKFLFKITLREHSGFGSSLFLPNYGGGLMENTVKVLGVDWRKAGPTQGKIDCHL